MPVYSRPFSPMLMLLTLLLLLGVLFVVRARHQNTPPVLPPPSNASTTRLTMPGGVSFAYPPKDYGLATTRAQVLVLSYIPPCDEHFDYCLYRIRPDLSGTNFESAGLRVKRRADLKSSAACLSTPPAGYHDLRPKEAAGQGYEASAFAVSGAAMGHSAIGTLYRLFADGSCTEFETRIGQSQFENFPPGSIRKFTATDERRVAAELSSLLASVRTPADAPVSFPQP